MMMHPFSEVPGLLAAVNASDVDRTRLWFAAQHTRTERERVEEAARAAAAPAPRLSTRMFVNWLLGPEEPNGARVGWCDLINGRSRTAASRGWTSVDIAVRRSAAPLLAELLERGCSPCVCYENNAGWITAVEAVTNPQVRRRIAVMLLANGARANATSNANKRTALHFLAERGSVSMIPLLVAYGADVNAQDANGDTPLLVALNATRIAAAKALLDAGADATLANRAGVSPETRARSSSQQMGFVTDHVARLRQAADPDGTKTASALQSRPQPFGRGTVTIIACLAGAIVLQLLRRRFFA
jgi:hypothetical protein